MNISYDADTDAAYISLMDKPGVNAAEVAPEMVLDFDSDGNVVGIDIYGNARARVDISSLVTKGFEFEEIRRDLWTKEDDE